MTRPAKHRPLELRVWFALMDLTRWIPGSRHPESGSLHSRLFSLSVRKSAECVDWGALEVANDESWS